MTLYPIYEKNETTYRPYNNVVVVTPVNASYKVNHYQMNLDGINYTLVETEELTGEVNSRVKPAPKTYGGFTSPEATEVVVAADGSALVEYKYTRNKYTFIIEEVEDITTTNSSENGEYYYGAEITLSATVDDTDYVIEKWASSNTNLLEDIILAEATFKMPASDITLTPSKTLRTYTIDYDFNNGLLESGKVNPVSFTKETSDITLNNPSKVGYTFIGWTGSNGEIPELTVAIPSGTKENLTYKANYIANIDTAYQVIHKLMDTSGEAYVSFEVENLAGTTDSIVMPSVKTY